ncbi:MAG: hypothetical protein JNG90_14485, partial [Planctomycetaceae bacterium]|nr:hypothetical protein [Planctomycetaceae bacterium]
GDVLEPIGRFKNIGPLQLNNFATAAGWMSVGLVPATPVQTAAQTAAAR